MYVTKKNMATAVTNLTKHLEHVSDALAVSFVYELDFSIMFSYFVQIFQRLVTDLGYLL